MSGASSDSAGSARRPRARRFPLLDLARIVAALMVVFYHWCFMFNVPDAAVGLKPWRELLPAAQYGYLGVNLFFMISGFLIVQSAYDKTWQAFVRARVVRLWPAYLACCMLTFTVTVVAGNAISTPDFLYNLTMLNGLIDLSLARTPLFVDGVYWTLAVEWAFYALVTCAIAARQLDRIERLLWIWTVVCIIDTIHPARVLDVLLIGSWGGYFIAGAAFFRASAKGWNFSRAGLVIVPFCDCAFQAVRLAADLTAVHHAAFNPVVVVGVIVIFFVFFALIASRREMIERSASRSFKTLGALSYPIYLLHQQIGAIVIARYWSADARYAFLAAALIALLALAATVHFGVETPIWAVLRRRKPRVAPATARQG